LERRPEGYAPLQLPQLLLEGALLDKPVRGEPRIGPHAQVARLHVLLGVRVVERAGLEVELSPTFRRGQKVLVTGGPLAGVTGVVVRQKNRRRLQVSVEAIMQAVLVDVAAEDLAPV